MPSMPGSTAAAEIQVPAAPDAPAAAAESTEAAAASELFGPLMERVAEGGPLSTTEAGLLLVGGMLCVCALLLGVLVWRTRHPSDVESPLSELGERHAEHLRDLEQRQGQRLDLVAQGHRQELVGLGRSQERSERVVREELARSRTEWSGSTRHLREEVTGSIRSVGESLEKGLEEVRSSVDLRLRHLQEENQKKLDEMRATVDEKLQGTLEKRLGESFRQVSERLEAVHKGLGEMQHLATGVGDLKKVLTNVKTRGTWGEVQLDALLEQVLSPGQWERQVPLRGGRERVDFALRLPGAEGPHGEPVYLPIDAKFPQEDYQRLVEAQERGDAAAAEEAGRGLEARLKAEARSVRDKYIHPPETTDFAVVFVPTEGLYAELLRRPGLGEWLQRECRVTIAGPTTLAAMLNSLQMGFRTLAIQERSDEVWRLLSAVRTQFGKFGDLLEKVDRKLQEASNQIGAASQKTRFIEKKLGKVEKLPEAEAEQLIPSNLDETAD